MLLIIDKSRKNGSGFADIFFYMGVLARCATPHEALSEISSIYSAAIIIDPSHLPDIHDYLTRIRSYGGEIPIFAICQSGEEATYKDLFCGVYKRGTYAAKIYEEIFDHTQEKKQRSPGIYKLAGINASANLSCSTFHTVPLPFTKTENMILRTLIRTYPRPISPKEILKYAFRESRTPDISNVRTHISIMNKKFRQISGRNMIESSLHEGYRILTPEISETLLTK